jgi:N-acyl amino acid synthase of PEP-CTERM/exosortase system
MLSHPTAAVNRKITPHHDNMLDAYNAWFRVTPATTPALQDQAYRLRYQVYCCEHSYENPAEHPRQREIDDYDDRSVHSLLVDRTSGTTVGTVRLIFSDKDSWTTSFPIQKVCSHPLLADRKLHLTAAAAEISRFAISKAYRNNTIAISTGMAADRAHMIPCITLGLFKATVQMSFEHGISDWFAVMEPSLLRLLSRFGIYFKPIGPLVDYHGLRQPCHANVHQLLERVRKERLDVFDFVTEVDPVNGPKRSVTNQRAKINCNCQLAG